MEITTITFHQLREANVQRLSAPAYVQCGQWQSAHWLQALVGEVGELANLLKKVDRGDFFQYQVQTEIAKELADIQCYLDLLSYKLGVNLGLMTATKFNEVSERICSPVRIEPMQFNSKANLLKKIEVFFENDLEDGWLTARLPDGKSVSRNHWNQLKAVLEKEWPDYPVVWGHNPGRDQYCPAELRVQATDPVPAQGATDDQASSEQAGAVLGNAFHTGGYVQGPAKFKGGGDWSIANSAEARLLSMGFIYNKNSNWPDPKDKRIVEVILYNGKDTKGRNNQFVWTDTSNPECVYMWRLSPEQPPSEPEKECPQEPAEYVLSMLSKEWAAQFVKHSLVPGSVLRGDFWIIFSDGALVPREDFQYSDNGDFLKPVYYAERS